jgi:hypothetical protein
VGLLTAAKDSERASARPDTPASALFTDSLSFQVYTSSQLQGTVAPDRSMVSLYLYHVTVNPTRRGTLGRVDAGGVRHAPVVPLDLHYLLTAWAKDADTQQRLLAWSVRVLQDTPTLGAGVLNSHVPEPVFRPEETVEIVWESLSQRDLFDIWDVARANQQPSAAYVARIVEIESTIPVAEYPLVQTTDFRYSAVRG